MTITEEMLSAYLDGELGADDVARVEQELAQDMALQTVLAELIEADQIARDAFAAQAAEPVPEALIAAIDGASRGKDEPGDELPVADIRPMRPEASTPPEPANSAAAPAISGWAIAAAVAGALLIGGAGGLYFGGVAGQETTTVAAWIEDIADYHRVYSQQVRHLVEVPASEADHIETWLTATLGSQVTIPDLEAEGLTFQGARLLVAAGKPVAQLLYTDASGGVVALCQIQTDTPQSEVREDTLNQFSLVSWGGEDANFVIVADETRPNLEAIVGAAANQV